MRHSSTKLKGVVSNSTGKMYPQGRQEFLGESVEAGRIRVQFIRPTVRICIVRRDCVSGIHQEKIICVLSGWKGGVNIAKL